MSLIHIVTCTSGFVPLQRKRPLLEVLGEHGRFVGVGAGVVEGIAVLSGAASSLRLAVVLEANKRSGIVVPSLAGRGKKDCARLTSATQCC